MSVAGTRVDRATLGNGDRVTIGTTELLFLLDRPTNATMPLPDGSSARLSGPSAIVSHSAAPLHRAPLLPQQQRDPKVSRWSRSSIERQGCSTSSDATWS